MTEWKLRPPRMEDADDLNAVRRSPQVVAGTTAIPTEDLEQTRAYLESNLGNDRWHALVVEAESVEDGPGPVVAMADLRVHAGKQRHVADLGIMVHDGHQGQGIGTRLMTALLDLADQELGLHRVELEVMVDNTHAIKLYEAMGFEEEGRKRDTYRKNGGFVDVLVMGRLNPSA